MESRNELKEIDIKNRACYYFDDIIKYKNVNFGDILLDEKLYKNISIYDISYKTSTGPKSLRIKFNKIDGFLMVFDGKIKHLVLFDHELFDKICNKIKYLISKKRGIKNSINHNFGRIRIDSYHFLPIKKILTFHNVIILIKSVVNKNNNDYYNIFLQNGSYKDKSDTRYFLMNFCIL